MARTMDWSNVRKSKEGKYAVLDVISQIRKCSMLDASLCYYTLLSQEKVPEFRVEDIGQRAPGCYDTSRFCLVATKDEIAEIISRIFGAFHASNEPVSE